KRKKLVKNNEGQYYYEVEKAATKYKTNYFSYAKRASVIMDSPSILHQIRNHRKIFNAAIFNHLRK
ncbi:MAG: hypothetical protein JWQ14_2743, partial [Adhaeribacter sp.]|nr:hypothetical protein [Adhaeribacter sp.]